MAAPLPSEFRALAGGRGARVNHPPGLAEAFRSWVQGSCVEGSYGDPNDRELRDDVSCNERVCRPAIQPGNGRATPKRRRSSGSCAN
jgi:hypothetical protein